MDLLSKKKINLPELKLPEINFTKKTHEIDLSVQKEKIELKKAINYALAEWHSAINNFENVDSPEMVEYYTYKMKACEVKYQYLLRQVKKMNENFND